MLILKGLNNDQERAEQLWKTYKIQLETLVDSYSYETTFPFEYIDEFGKIKQSEKDNLESNYPSIEIIYQHLSQLANHPLRIEGIAMDNIHSPGPEEDIVSLSAFSSLLSVNT